MKSFLYQSAKKAEIELTESKLEKFQIYYDHLLETNRSLNLTAITEMKDVVLKHFMDSIMVLKYYDLSNTSVIDVGTGAGFPGIPLAIMCPETEFVLLDSLKKRLLFIDSVVELCGLDNVKWIHGRAEDYGRNPKYRESFSYCVSRAVAPLPVLLELCSPFLKTGGKFISYKSELLEEELDASQRAMKLLCCELQEKREYEIPDMEIFRVYAVFEKTGKTSGKYPRQAGRPKKNPL